MATNLIRDPVHNLIQFDDSVTDRLLLNLINTREFQRLRRISQLGMTPLIFPGANHTRFAHSIGVLHVTRRILDRLHQLPDIGIDEAQRRIVLVAALLHDVGHGPFSHAFESITGDNHEQRTAEIIRDSSTEVNELLRDADPNMPAQVAAFFNEDPDEPGAPSDPVPAFLTQVVSSQLDADRFDYLLRDSYATGTSYGNFDIDWIIQHLRFDAERSRLILEAKAFHDAEAYVFARYHMYRTVYFHKATRAAEVMLRLLFRRFKELLHDDPTLTSTRLDRCPERLVHAFRGSLDLDDYLYLDDHTITEFLKVATLGKDPTLAILAGGLLNRRLFKSIDVTNVSSVKVADFRVEVNGVLTDRVREPDYNFAVDTPGDMAYKPYDPDDAVPATQIYVAQPFSNPKELATLSRGVATLRDRYGLTRYYFPPELRESIESIAHKTLR